MYKIKPVVFRLNDVKKKNKMFVKIKHEYANAKLSIIPTKLSVLNLRNDVRK